MSGRSGGIGDAARRVFGDGDNPLTWGLTLYTAWGIRVRVHIFFLIYIVLTLLMALPHGGLGIAYRASAMFMLFAFVLLHEYGHCIACRKVRGEADEILLWPLGGLASCLPPNTWKANLITTLGGPAVNALLAPFFALALVAITQSTDSVVFNYFKPWSGLGAATLPSGAQPFWLVLLWWAFFMNVVLFAFNMLVPMYPMDAGRTVHAILWAKLGYGRGTYITLTVGMVAAGVLAVLAIVWNEVILIALAIFGGLTCWQEKQRLRFMGHAEDQYDLSAANLSDREIREPTKRDEKKAERERKHLEEVDRILAKIKDEGMASLTKREKKTLERESAGQRPGP